MSGAYRGVATNLIPGGSHFKGASCVENISFCGCPKAPSTVYRASVVNQMPIAHVKRPEIYAKCVSIAIKVTLSFMGPPRTIGIVG